MTTKGFRDVLEIARMSRDGMYNLWYKRPPPFVPRPLRLEVAERVNAAGKVLQDVNLADVQKAIRIFKQKEVEAIAVCFLHSYTNPKHEREVRKILSEKLPNIPVSLSFEVAREYREYERTNTTVLDAYIKPLMSKYVSELNAQLKDRGFRGKLLISLSAGGVQSALVSASSPIKAFNSGPAGGVVGMANLAETLNRKDVIGVDAGGTSFDVSLIVEGRPTIAEQTTVDSYPILVPAIDIRSIGAGGGSIAWIDPGGHLHVGPQSSSAVPGPMCYGRGGLDPTVTDAALVSGILDPNYFLGGTVKLRLDLAEQGIDRLANSLALKREEAAAGIMSIATANMAGAVREITVVQGLDPRDFSMFSFGGATSMFVADFASELGVSSVLVPREPGNFSAWGMLFMDIVYYYSRTLVTTFENPNIDLYSKAFEELEKEGARALAKENVSIEHRRFERFADLRYEWQSHYLQVRLPLKGISAENIETIKESFHELHERNYGHRRPAPIQTVHLRVRAVGILSKPQMPSSSDQQEKADAAIKGKRDVWVRGRGRIPFTVYERSKLISGNEILGPAIVEEETSTTL
ncbi:MAG: hydantoinase/oxoprolinase family protein, partial [Nitrososphaerales archaeon]